MEEAQQLALMNAIDEKIGDVRTEAIDLTFGEIVNLQAQDEIRINPEYQRLFRWSQEQKSRLVESILLRLPIPPVFFVENEDGRYELIDGLQRISSMIQFIEAPLIDTQPLILEGCDIITHLNKLSFDDLPLTLKLQVKRSSVRAIVIKRQSKHFLRYEMFKRLNTGGSLLSPQEIRNCSARLFGERGVAFYDSIISLSSHESFINTTDTLAEVDLEKRGREELVLRFFAAKNGAELYKGNVSEWLDAFMESILLEKIPFDTTSEEIIFKRTFDAVNRILGDSAFCKLSNDRPIGGLAPAHYEAIAIAISNELEKCEGGDISKIKQAITAAKQSNQFRENVGPGANNRTKLAGRIRAISEAIQQA